MSWHTSAIFIQRELGDGIPDFLNRLGFVGIRERGSVSFDDATSYRLDGIAVANIDGWTIAFDSPGMFGAGHLPDLPDITEAKIWPERLEGQLASMSKDGKSLAFLLEGSTGTYGLAAFVNGECVRTFLHHHQKIRLNAGVPIAGEDPPLENVPLHEYEMAIFNVTDQFCLPFDRFAEATYLAFDYESGPI
jgi:hypothetical protein